MEKLIGLLVCEDYIFAEMATLLVKSLRDKGQYKDRIRIFTNLDLKTYDFDNCEIFPIAGLAHFDTKVQILEQCSDCDQYMFIDADCLVTTDINPIFNYEPSTLRYTVEPESSMADNLVFYPWLSEKERNEARITNRPGINSGIYLLPGSMTQELKRMWLPYVAARESDQWGFNAIIVREIFKSAQLPKAWVEYPLEVEKKNKLPDQRINSDNKIYHFCTTLCDRAGRQMAMKKVREMQFPVGRLPFPLTSKLSKASYQRGIKLY